MSPMLTAQRAGAGYAVRRALRVLLVGALALLVLLGGSAVAPRVELAVAPVLSGVTIDEIRRHGDVLGWRLRGVKERDAALLGYVATVTADGSHLYTVGTYPCTSPTDLGLVRRREPGPFHTRTCIVIPQALRSADRLTVQVTLIYDVGPRPWSTLVRLPEVTWRGPAAG